MVGHVVTGKSRRKLGELRSFAHNRKQSLSYELIRSFCNHFPGEPVDDELVGDHHDGGVGDLPAELGDHAAVEPPPPLLAVHQEDRLPELAVPRVALAKARTGNLCKPKKKS